MKITNAKFELNGIKFNEDDIIHVNEKMQFHNLEGPAIEFGNGDFSWYKDGALHRDYGIAEYSNKIDIYGNLKIKAYYVNGKLHRENGPAFVRNSSFTNDSKDFEYYEEYFSNGITSRVDGPAVTTYNFLKNEITYYMDKFIIGGNPRQNGYKVCVYRKNKYHDEITLEHVNCYKKISYFESEVIIEINDKNVKTGPRTTIKTIKNNKVTLFTEKHFYIDGKYAYVDNREDFRLKQLESFK